MKTEKPKEKKAKVYYDRYGRGFVGIHARIPEQLHAEMVSIVKSRMMKVNDFINDALAAHLEQNKNG